MYDQSDLMNKGFMGMPLTATRKFPDWQRVRYLKRVKNSLNFLKSKLSNIQTALGQPILKKCSNPV